MPTLFAERMSVVVDSLAPLLKQVGYRKRRHVFNREVEPGLIHVVSFEMGRFEFGDDIPGLRESTYGEFQIEFGVFVDEICAGLDGRPGITFAHGYDCAIRVVSGQTTLGTRDVQLGDLTVPGVGQYSLNLKAEPAQVIAETHQLLINEALPFLERLGSRRALVDAWLRGELDAYSVWGADIAAAVVLQHLGEKGAAKRLAAGLPAGRERPP